MPKPLIAITMGDPAGVGPEICLRLLNEASIADECVPVIFGTAMVLRRVSDITGIPFTAPVIRREDWGRERLSLDQPAVLDIDCISAVAVATPAATAKVRL